MTPTTTPARALLALAVGSTLLLAACGGSSSDGAKATTTTAPATTTTKAPKAPKAPKATTTTTEADDAPALPTDEDAAPSGDWIGVRFLAGQDPEPKDFQPGYAEARLYSITPDCSSSAGCTLKPAGGGDDGSFAMPDVEPLTGDPLVLTPSGDEWTSVEHDPAGACSDSLDGEYLATTETRKLSPVYDADGKVTGIVGTTVYEDTLTDEGRAAGCPASAEGTSVEG